MPSRGPTRVTESPSAATVDPLASISSSGCPSVVQPSGQKTAKRRPARSVIQSHSKPSTTPDEIRPSSEMVSGVCVTVFPDPQPVTTIVATANRRIARGDTPALLLRLTRAAPQATGLRTARRPEPTPNRIPILRSTRPRSMTAALGSGWPSWRCRPSQRAPANSRRTLTRWKAIAASRRANEASGAGRKMAWTRLGWRAPTHDKIAATHM